MPPQLQVVRHTKLYIQTFVAVSNSRESSTSLWKPDKLRLNSRTRPSAGRRTLHHCTSTYLPCQKCLVKLRPRTNVCWSVERRSRSFEMIPNCAKHNAGHTKLKMQLLCQPLAVRMIMALTYIIRPSAPHEMHEWLPGSSEIAMTATFCLWT